MTTEQLTIGQRLDTLEAGQARLEAGQERLEPKFKNTARLVSVEASQVRLEARMDVLEAGQARLEVQQDRLETKFDRLAAKQDSMQETMMTIIEGQGEILAMLARMDERLTNMEARQDRVEAKQERLYFWVLGLMTAAVISLAAIAARLLFMG